LPYVGFELLQIGDLGRKASDFIIEALCVFRPGVGFLSGAGLLVGDDLAQIVLLPLFSQHRVAQVLLLYEPDLAATPHFGKLSRSILTIQEQERNGRQAYYT
jgi:hypothetical protein